MRKESQFPTYATEFTLKVELTNLQNEKWIGMRMWIALNWDSRIIELEHATVMFTFGWLPWAWESIIIYITQKIVLLIAGWNEKLNHLLHCYEDSNWTHEILWNFLNGCHFYGCFVFFLFNRHWKTFIATQVCSGYVSWFWHLAKTMPFIYFILRFIHWTDYIV